MGNTQAASTFRTSITSEDRIRSKQNQNLREHKRNGVVQLKISSLTTNRRNQEVTVNHTITPRGSILYGSMCNPLNVQMGKQLTINK
jgi:hypothetical protein